MRRFIKCNIFLLNPCVNMLGAKPESNLHHDYYFSEAISFSFSAT